MWERSYDDVSMDWNAVSAIANVLVAFAVTITVVYLAIQIRENTRATRSQTYQLATAALAEMAGIIGADKELARIFRIGGGVDERDRAWSDGSGRVWFV